MNNKGAAELAEALAAVFELIEKGDAIGSWLSAAIEDEQACAKLKADALAFLTVLHPFVSQKAAPEVSL